MDTRTFEDLLSWVAPIIQKSSLRRSTTTPAERLCVTLRYLATGDSQTAIDARYRISPTTIGRIISETCQTLWTVLNEKCFIKAPDSEEEWLTIAAEFNSKWNFPHCLSTIDGKDNLQAPAKSGSSFFNYKKCFSIVLLAVCNVNIVCIPPLFLLGELNLLPNFQKGGGGGLTGPQVLEGVCWERGGDFFQGEWNF